MGATHLNIVREGSFGIFKKSASFILALFLLLEPAGYILAAQETASTTKSGVQSPASGASLGGGMVSSMSSGGGNIDVSRNLYDSGRYSDIDQLSGTFTYEIPIVVPPGRNGIEPQLSLRYNSQPQLETSVVGYGWDLSIPFIERINKRGTDRMFSDTDFYATLSGELASTTGTTYKAKIENGDFMTYEFSGNTWTVTDKVGTVYTFGSTAGTRQDHPSNSATTSKWMLDEIRDRNGNYSTYTYYKDGGQIYPSTITYTHSSTSADGIFEVAFNRESRTHATSSAAGFPVVTKERIAQIETKINGTWVRKYELDYTSPENRTKSLLATVTEYGRADDGSTTTRPAYQFSYQESGQKGWSTDGSWVPPIPIAEETGVSLGTHFADINGDGRPDLLQSRYDSGTSEKKIYVHNGTNVDGGWSLNTSWTYPWGPYFIYNDVLNPFFPIDVNSDGYDDFIYNGTSTALGSVYLNTKSGWATSTTEWALPTSFVNDAQVTSVRLLDVNGDQLPDILKADAGGGGMLRAYVNNGVGWATSTIWEVPQYFVSSSTDLGVIFIELNGDGLPDLVRSYKNTTPDPDEEVNVSYLNTGAGWATSTTWVHPSADEIIENGKDMGFRFGELNGDSFTDMVRGYSASPVLSIASTTLNTNTGWLDVSSTWVFPSAFTDYNGLEGGMRFLDLNSDTLNDIFISRASVPSGVVKRIDFNTSKQVDVLSQIVVPQGGTTTVEYKSSHSYKNGATMLNTQLPYPILTVATTTDRDGRGNVSTTAYSYEGGKMYWNSSYDRKFAGFNTVTKRDAEGNVTKTYFHQGSTTESSLGEYDDHFSKIGKAYRVDQYDTAGNLYNTSINKWDKDDLGNGRYFVKLAEKLTLSFDGDSDHRDTLETFSYASGTGNIIEKVSYGEVVGSTTGTYTDSGSDKFTTSLTYATNTTYGIYALPSSETILNQSGTKVRESRFYYDTLSLGNVTNGNLTKQEQWVSGTTYVDVEKTYNTYGLVATETDARDKTTTYTYDAYNLYPATTTNAVSHVIGRQFDYSSGKVKVLRDANGHVFETTYDGFDRVVREKQPDIAAPSTLVTRSELTYTDTSLPTKVQRTDYLNAGTTTDAYTYFDGFGRKIEERVEAEGSNTYAVKDFVYNTRGLVARESLPYFSSSTAYTGSSTPPANALFISYTYDPLARVKTVANVVGTTTNTYDDWSATTTDAIGNYKGYRKDAYGNLVTVLERSSTSTYMTSYEYNGNNKLTKITDAEANIRNFTYDGLGRRLTAQDLHDVSDGTYGTWTFVYDAAGNIASTTDPKSQIVSYTYDDVNRVLTEDYTGAGGTEVTYGYDGCSNGKGRLCGATTTDAITAFVYNPLGLVSSEQKTLNSVAYVTVHAYDRLGNKTDTTYPDNSQVQYVYNAAGGLEVIRQKESGGAFSDIVSDFNYGPHGQVTTQFYGNGASTTKTYDAAELYRLRSIVTAASSTAGMGGGGSALLTLENALGLNDEPFVLSEAVVTEPNTDPMGQAESIIAPENDVPNVPPAAAETTLVTEEIPNESVTTPTTESVVSAEPDTTLLTESLPVPLDQEATTTVEVVPEVPLARATTSLSSLLEGKTAYEKATMKGVEMAKLPFGQVKKRKQYDIEIVNIEPRERGVTVYARAWDKGKQIGFGTDGSVDVERFIFINPPILVPDPQGDIVRTAVDSATGEVLTFTYREDLEEALLQALEHTIEVKKEKFSPEHIVTGKVGRTTTTVYPDANPETTSVDGQANFDGYSGSWATVHDAATANAASDTQTQSNGVYTGKYAGPVYFLYRAFFLFDTSSLTDDIISSATFSQNPYAKVTAANGNTYISLATSSPASNTAITTADYDMVGTTKLATDINTSAVTLNAYNDWTLNATGRSTINGDGISKFVLRHGNDIMNTDPTTTGDNGINGIRWADVTGTTQDPKLVIEHTACNCPKPPSPFPQSKSYSYDAVGNITRIIDLSRTATAATTTYEYDALYRLTAASTTLASSTPFKHSYAYSPVGNMTAMSTSTSATTSYTYGETGYTNPHAPTQIGGATLTYDNNGNLTSKTGITYTWDYRNRMTATGQNGATTTYAYDHTYERTKKVTASSTTYYPNDLYSKEGATTTKFIYGNGTLLATVEGNGTATSTKYYHPDHLGGTSVVTNSVGTIVSATDYYPFGAKRISVGTTQPPRQYIGEFFDASTDLQYLNARYYDGGRGQFLSQDQMFWRLPPDLLMDPQSMNSYSYANNNPINKEDPSGLKATIKINAKNKTITIKSTIYIHGKGATKDVAKRMEKNISDTWNQGFTYDIKGDTYAVKFDIKVKTTNIPSLRGGGSDSNVVKVEGTDRSYVNSNGKTGTWRENTPDPSPHEYGHLIGLDDRYTDKKGSNEGWSGNIMAEPAMQGKVEQKNIDSIVSPYAEQFNNRWFPKWNQESTYTIDVTPSR